MLIEKADTWIISKIFDPISHKVQTRTGHTCYYLAWWAVGIAMLVGLVDVSQYLRLALEAGAIPPDMASAFWVEVGAFPFFLFFCIMNLYKWQKLWERKQWQSSTLPETRTIFWVCIRLFLVSVCFVLLMTGPVLVFSGETTILEFFLSNFDFISLTIAEYFAACTPMPPSAHKRQEAELPSGAQPSAMHRNAA